MKAIDISIALSMVTLSGPRVTVLGLHIVVHLYMLANLNKFRPAPGKCDQGLGSRILVSLRV